MHSVAPARVVPATPSGGPVAFCRTTTRPTPLQPCHHQHDQLDPFSLKDAEDRCRWHHAGQVKACTLEYAAILGFTPFMTRREDHHMHIPEFAGSWLIAFGNDPLDRQQGPVFL